MVNDIEQFTAPGKYHYEMKMKKIISIINQGENKYHPFSTNKIPPKINVPKRNNQVRQTYDGNEKQWRKDLR